MEKILEVQEKLNQLRRTARLNLAVAAETKQAVRQRAAEAIEDVDLAELFELMGAERGNTAAQEAMRAVLAERIAECAIGAMQEVKRRKIKMGAAAVIIAAARK